MVGKLIKGGKMFSIEEMQLQMNKIHNVDCLDFMRQVPDNYFDLVLTDPPYGIGAYANGTMGGGVLAKQSTYKKTTWDSNIPTLEVFQEICRVSKNQIVFGGNYFSELLPSSKSFLIWDKQQHLDNFSQCEYIWTSLNLLPKIFQTNKLEPYECNIYNTIKRIHPTQKPIRLYEWILSICAKPNDLILDTHCGSASSLIACENLGFKYIASELDKDYYEQSLERLKTHLLQGKLFQPVGGGNKIETPSMFA